ncbi:glycoside hydrolase family 113 [Hymenobacter sp. AT01-02]|uniref:glycoside hydrolase family 113 n=1 Tax=Hymenobacter sp. AT01-02 TaxID=1571877 RepID=UPI000A6AA42E|nr:hypothetical protein [Hymenobacter sp. AT01-02]
MFVPRPASYPVLWLLLVVAVAAGSRYWQYRSRLLRGTASATTQPTLAVPRAERMRGVNWVAADSLSAQDMEPLVQAHVTWIAQTPFGWQPDAAKPEIRVRTASNGRGFWGEGDQGLLRTAQWARQRGIRTLLKPHLWLRTGGTWPGDVRMTSSADWQAWFVSYSAFMLHYAALAEQGHMEALCIGTELEHASTEHETEWRELIRQIRAVYHGPLTYAANWSGEFEKIRFWDALDFIGVQAYFPLSTTNHPDKQALLKAWAEPRRRLEAVQRRYHKPIVFTEVGYKTTPDAAIEPWKWPDRTALPATPDEATQAACYAAMFETFWPRPWLQGVFVWKWYPGLQADGSARRILTSPPSTSQQSVLWRSGLANNSPLN